MPTIRTGSIETYYRIDGIAGRPVLVLSHSLGQDHGMWAPQVEPLAEHFQVLRYDTRGHGATSAPGGEYSIAQLGQDVLALTEALGIERFAFAGLSLGGMVGQWLACHASDRVTAVVFANTTAKLTDPSAMETRRQTVLSGGMASIVDTVMARFFSPRVIRQRPGVVDAARRVFLATSPVGYAGCCAAVRDLDHAATLASITVPVLIVSGDHDVSMPWPEHAARLAAELPRAKVVRLAAAHLSNLERPRSFTAAMVEFLLPPPTGTVESGFPVRRAVLGDEHVDRAIAHTTEFTRDFQELITRYAWGSIWARPGLDHRTRRLLVLTTLAALGRWEEFRMHLTTGLAHELEWPDVKEALMQVAIYAGVPVANQAFHLAAEEMAKRQD